VRRSRLGFRLGVLLIAVPLAIYLALLAFDAYSVHQASVALSRLESLKLGDPVSAYDQAVASFAERDGTQVLVAGAFRVVGPILGRIWRINQDVGDQLNYFCNNIGLRFWELRANSSSQDGKLTRVSLKLHVVGRTALGSEWALVPEITDFRGRTPSTDLDRRVFASSYPLVSDPPGEGYHFEISSQATSQELQIREINTKCLFSLHACNDVCELTPNLLTMLRQRNRLWLEAKRDIPPLPCGAK
jgi:hypothetical protein